MPYEKSIIAFLFCNVTNSLIWLSVSALCAVCLHRYDCHNQGFITSKLREMDREEKREENIH